MGLEARIQTELMNAMRSRNEARLRALRAIKSAIMVSKTSEGNRGVALPEAEETKLLQKLVKQRRESIAIYEKEGRADLARAEQEELTVIEEFLPAQMDGPAIESVLKRIIAQTGAASASDLGKVMAAAVRELAGQADNKVVSAMAKKLLS